MASLLISIVAGDAWNGHVIPEHVRLKAPRYENTVMPYGACTIPDQDGMKVPWAQPIDNAHVIPTFMSPHYGLHVLVLGRDSKLYHKHQTLTASGEKGGKWTEWKCLTQDLTKVPCSSAPHCGGYDNNPVVAWQPVNGTAVAFVRQMDDLTIHELHLTDPTDPDSWSKIRGPVCLCNFPPCTNLNQTKCGTESNCDNKGVDCDLHPPSSNEFWSTQPSFPTSDLSLLSDGEHLNLYYRGFDGGYYTMQQLGAGDASGKYSAPNRVGSINDINGVVE